MIETKDFIYFFGSIYSQWFPSYFEEGGTVYNTAEQYMMYHKAMYCNDLDSAKRILKSVDPAEQKRLGRQVQGFDDQKWDLVKRDIVYQGNLLKFSQNEDLKHTLIVDHKNKMFVEASPTDTIWGIGLGLGDERIYDQNQWKGQNLLGIAIKQVQSKLSQ
jgi:ribA/ribD-fused uncharacterized protein